MEWTDVWQVMVAGPSPGSGGSTPPEFWNFQVGVMERTDVLQVMGATLCQDQAVALLLKQFGMDHYTIQVSWSNICTTQMLCKSWLPPFASIRQ